MILFPISVFGGLFPYIFDFADAEWRYIFPRSTLNFNILKIIIGFFLFSRRDKSAHPLLVAHQALKSQQVSPLKHHALLWHFSRPKHIQSNIILFLLFIIASSKTTNIITDHDGAPFEVAYITAVVGVSAIIVLLGYE
jgi:hypothetical protein